MVYLFNATLDNFSVISHFVATSDVLDADFSDDENFLLFGTEDGAVYEHTADCLECLPGYFKNTVTVRCELCWTTLLGCGICSSSSVCVECIEGYIINSTSNLCLSCEELIEGCGTCDSTTVCTSCLPGYYLDGNSCSKCTDAIEGCLICNSSSFCSECEVDFY